MIITIPTHNRNAHKLQKSIKYIPEEFHHRV